MALAYWRERPPHHDHHSSPNLPLNGQIAATELVWEACAPQKATLRPSADTSTNVQRSSGFQHEGKGTDQSSPSARPDAFVEKAFFAEGDELSMGPSYVGDARSRPGDLIRDGCVYIRSANTVLAR